MTTTSAAAFVPAGQDIYGQRWGLGVSTMAFKVAGQGEQGLFVLENTFHAQGGPARHLHYAQDEWFYVLEGEFIVEVGGEQFRLRPGDSVLAPRRVPHAPAHVGDAVGRLLVTFSPAGQMEAFFRLVTPENRMPVPDPALWRAYGMEVTGPPIEIP